MTDITRLARFQGGLPRDVDMTKVSLQALSFKVGDVDPVDLTKELAALLDTFNTSGVGSTHIAAGAVQSQHLDASAKQAVLESKKAAFRLGLLNISATNNASDVSTLIATGAPGAMAVGDGVAIAAVSDKGIFVGTVAGASDVGKVLIRAHGTDNGIEDGNGDEIYGVLSFLTMGETDVYTLSYKKANGDTFNFIEATDIDAFVVQVKDLYDFSVEQLLMPGLGGVIDATSMSAISDLQTELAAEISARMDADNTLELEILANLLEVQTSITTEANAREESDNSLNSALDVLEAAIENEESARMEADVLLTSAIDAEITARMDADTTLELEILANLLEVQASITTEANAREESDNSLYSALSVLDTAIENEESARMEADVLLTSAIDAEITARMDADNTLELEILANLLEVQTSITTEANAREESDNSLYSALSVLDTAIENEESARIEADNSLQAELDLTQGTIGAMVLGDGSFDIDIFSATNYLSAEGTITTALIKLDSELDSEMSARMEADTSLQAYVENEVTMAIDAEITSRMEADTSLEQEISDNLIEAQTSITTEANAREESDNSLYSALSVLDTAIENEESARIEADNSLQAELDLTQGTIGAMVLGDGSFDIDIFSATNYLSAEGTITTALIKLDSELDSEMSARMEADTSLQAYVENEVTMAIDAEITARMEADTSLEQEISANLIEVQTSITTEADAREESDNSLYSALSVLDTAIENEESARMEADVLLTSAIDDEITARMEADNSLQVELDTTQGTIGSMIDGATGGFNAGTFADTNYLGAETTITTALMKLDIELDSEMSARMEADTSLQAYVENEVTTAIDAEITARMEADTSLEAALDAAIDAVNLIEFTAGETIAAGDVVAASTTDAGKVFKAQANTLANCEGVIGIASTGGDADALILVQMYGEVVVVSGSGTYTLGKRVYLSAATAGSTTSSAPESANNAVYLVGIATATDKLYLRTNLEYVIAE